MVSKREVTYALLHVQTFMTVFVQFTSSDDFSVMILYNPCLYIPCMILVSAVHHSFRYVASSWLSPSPEQARPYVEASNKSCVTSFFFFGTSSKSRKDIKKFQRE